MVEYRFNNGRGAVLCSVCRVIIDDNLSSDEADKRWRDGRDKCVLCKKKKKEK